MFDLLNALGPTVSLAIVVIGAILVAFRIYVDYKTNVIDKVPVEFELRAKETPSNIDNLSNLLIQNFRVLNRFYSENLSQYRTSSIASIAISVLGFVVIIAGILIVLITGQATLGTVSSAAGIVAEAAAVLFYRQNRVFQAQMQDSLNRLVSSQYMMTSIALARELDEESKRKEVSRINVHLRSLMDWLHGKMGS